MCCCLALYSAFYDKEGIGQFIIRIMRLNSTLGVIVTMSVHCHTLVLVILGRKTTINILIFHSEFSGVCFEARVSPGGRDFRCSLTDGQ